MQRIDALCDKKKKICVLVSDRVWSKEMTKILAEKTSYDFKLISDKSDLNVDELSLIDPQFIFFPHWSHRIPNAVFERFECVIFHMTDLPYGRGGSPLQNLIARGIYETQITALQCAEEMDAGPIYLKRPFNLHGAAEDIFLRAASVIEDMIVEILSKRPEPIAQKGSPTLFARRKPHEGDLTTATSLLEVFDLIRMLDADGYPNAFLNIGPFKLEFTRASRKSDQIIADVRISMVDHLIEKDT